MPEPGVRSATASSALAGPLAGPVRPVPVLAAMPRAVYLEHPGGVLAVVTRDGIALPNALLVGAAELPAATGAAVGGGGVELGGVTVRVTRWWDPVPRLAEVAPAVLAERLAEAERALPAWPPPQAGPSAPALARGLDRLRDDPAAGARALVGLGPGLTPAGDDVVAGYLAGLRLLGGAVPRSLVEAVAVAARGTTALSATLLRHAARGEVVPQAGRLLRALAGMEPVAGALEPLLAIGHTSGHDLAVGITTAAAATASAHAA